MDEKENTSAEELEALRQSLIEKDFTAKCQKWLYDLRISIAIRAYRNVQFRASKDNETVYDIEPDIYQLLYALQGTGWTSILSLSLNGGTTSSNCVPTCRLCNSRKSRHHPDELGSLFSAETIVHIREYLDSQQTKGI